MPVRFRPLTLLDADDSLIYLQILLFFLYEIVAAALIGFVFGLSATFITKTCRFIIHSELHTIGSILGFGYLTFCFAKAFSLAGIVSILVAALILSHYMVYNLEPSTQQKVM